MSKFLTLAVAMMLTLASPAQDDPILPRYIERQNSLMVNAGFIGLYATLAADYSRRLARGDRNSFWISGGGALYTGWGVGGHYFKSNLTWIYGRKNHFLEVAGGAAYLYERLDYEDEHRLWEDLGRVTPEPQKADFWNLTPSGLLGYRFQKTQSRIFLRTGLGFPESAYVGMGSSF